MSDKLRACSAWRGFVPDVNCLGCGSSILLDERTYTSYQGQVTCKECQAHQYIATQDGRLVFSNVQGTFLDAIRDILIWRIPQERLNDVAEAAHVLLQSALKSCVVMCRRCIQGTLLDKNVPDQPLGRMIASAETQGLITKELADQLRVIKLFGDVGAHPDDQALNDVTQFNAAFCVQLTKEVLKVVYPVRQT